MKHFCQLFFFSLIITLAACGPSTPPPTSESEESILPTQQSEEGLRVALTPTSEGASNIEAAPAAPTTPSEEAYPIPIPTPIIMDEDYPAPPTRLPQPTGYDAYPAAENTVWILFPVGEQCADESRYPDLTTAVSDLTAAGLTIFEAEVVEMIVCSACGCPTSAHYRVSIDAAQIETAQSMEWTAEE